MVSGRIFPSLMVTAGLSVLSPKLTNTGIAATNNRNFVGIPDYKSNILAEYRLPVILGAFLNFDWQHVGRRAIDDINSAYTPQYNLFDFGARYTTKLFGKVTTWRITANNASECALLVHARPWQHHGTEYRQLSGASGRAAADDRFDAVRFLEPYVEAFVRTAPGRRLRRRRTACAFEPATDHLSCRQSDACFYAAR